MSKYAAFRLKLFLLLQINQRFLKAILFPFGYIIKEVEIWRYTR